MLKPKIGLGLGLLLGVAAAGPSQTKDQSAVRVDRHGDPLPPGAIARLGTLRFRIDDAIVGLDFAPDGKTIAVRGSNGVWLLDAVSGKQLRQADRSGRLNPFVAFSIAFSPDGKQLIAAGYVGEKGRFGQILKFRYVVRIWETASSRKVMESELDTVRGVGWSAEAKPLAVYLGKGELRVRELATSRERRFSAKDLPEPKHADNCPCIMANGVLAASDEKCLIHVWDLANDKERCLLKTGMHSVESLALAPDGRRLASIAQDNDGKNYVHVWDTSTGVAVHCVAKEQKDIAKIVFSPDGRMLATVGKDEIRFWETKTGRQRGRLQVEGRRAPNASFSPDGNTLAIAEADSVAIHLRDVAHARKNTKRQGHTRGPGYPSFSLDGKRVATSNRDEGTIFIWNPATGEPLARIHHRDTHGCAFLADGRTLCSCGEGNKLYWDDAVSGRQLHVRKIEHPKHPDSPPHRLRLEITEDRARLIVFSSHVYREVLVTAWDAATRKQLFQRRRADDFPRLSPDGRILAAVDGRVLGERRPPSDVRPMYLEDLARGDVLLTFPRLESEHSPLAFSPDGRLLASLSFDAERIGKKGDPAAATGAALHLWEIATAAEVLALPLDYRFRCAFSPNSTLLALTVPPDQILIWDLGLGCKRQHIEDFNAEVKSFIFSPDSRQLVTGLSDSTLLVWEVASRPAVPAHKFGAEETAQAWADLAGMDARQAFRARGKLASAPEQTIRLLRKRLHPAKAADPQRLRRLLADLDSEQFMEREKAQMELEKLGDLAEAALRQALANKASLEVRRRVQAMLERLRGPVKRPDLLQALRAVAVLEDIGTPPARRLLEELRKGASESRLTREANASLHRLDLRNSSRSRDR